MEYHKIGLNSARNCFRYLIRALGIKEIYLPYYLCPVIRISAVKEGCKVRFYHINDKFFPVEKFPEDAYVLYPNYFGVCGKNINILEQEYKNLIVDNAHSFFSEPCGLASFNSVRKFFPEIRDGAFLYVKDIPVLSFAKSEYRYEFCKMSRQEFYLNEARIDNEDIVLMSELSQKYLLSCDLEKIKDFYLNKFNSQNNTYIDINLLKFELSENDIPYKYPLLCDNVYVADWVARKFISEGYEIYRYWENLPPGFPENIFRNQLVAI